MYVYIGIICMYVYIGIRVSVYKRLTMCALNPVVYGVSSRNPRYSSCPYPLLSTACAPGIQMIFIFNVCITVSLLSPRLRSVSFGIPFAIRILQHLMLITDTFCAHCHSGPLYAPAMAPFAPLSVGTPSVSWSETSSNCSTPREEVGQARHF